MDICFDGLCSFLGWILGSVLFEKSTGVSPIALR